jgi:HPt (histidine-containing phosphotransfer) domain-containing protein
MKERNFEQGHGIFDLEALKSRCLGNLELVERVLKSFATQLDADLEKLERALGANDLAAFASVAHRIKGMSANVEARSLCEHASRAEQRALENGPAELPADLARMRGDRDRLADSFAHVALNR